MNEVGWSVLHPTGSVAERHAAPVTAGCREVRVHRVDTATVVLGSGTRDVPASVAASGLPVVRRRSGGGGVLLEPDAQLWVDVVVPRGDALWDDDVSRSGLWLGQAWAGVVRELGLDATVHDGAMSRDDLAASVCFAGRASGEVLVGARKVVGVAQRRTREGARFQTALALRFDVARHARVFGVESQRVELARRAAGLGDLVAPVPDPDELVTRLLAHLPV